MPGAGLLTITGRETLQIDTAGNHLDLSGGRATVADHLRALVEGGSDDAVGLLDQLAFHFQAQSRFGLRRIGQLFEMGQGVEHRKMRHAPAAGKLLTGHAGEPVVAVQKVIGPAFVSGKILNLARKGWQILIEIVFVDGSNRPGLDMDHAHAWSKLDNFGLSGLRTASENVNGAVGAAQFAGQFADIDIHASGVLRAPGSASGDVWTLSMAIAW